MENVASSRAELEGERGVLTDFGKNEEVFHGGHDLRPLGLGFARHVTRSLLVTHLLCFCRFARMILFMQLYIRDYTRTQLWRQTIKAFF